MSEHKIFTDLDGEMMLAAATCSCGEFANIVSYVRTTGSDPAFRLAQEKGKLHIRTLPCIEPDSQDFIGFDDHDWSPWTDRPDDLSPGTVQRLRSCHQCNSYETGAKL